MTFDELRAKAHQVTLRGVRCSVELRDVAGYDESRTAIIAKECPVLVFDPDGIGDVRLWVHEAVRLRDVLLELFPLEKP